MGRERLSDVDPSGRDPEITAILNDYGFFLDEAGQHDKAISVLQVVIARDPNRAVAYLNLADKVWLENVVFTGTGNVTITGNDSDNNLSGAAGNDNQVLPYYPAAYENVLAVGATNSNSGNPKASFSNASKPESSLFASPCRQEPQYRASRSLPGTRSRSVRRPRGPQWSRQEPCRGDS